MYNLTGITAPIDEMGGVTVPVDMPITNNHDELTAGFKICKKLIHLHTFFNNHGQVKFDAEGMAVARELLVQETVQAIRATSLGAVVTIDEELVMATKRARMTPPANMSALESKLAAAQPDSSSSATPSEGAPLAPQAALPKAGATKPKPKAGAN